VIGVAFAITTRTTVRAPDSPVAEYRSGSEKICPVVTVKLVAEPIMVPLLL
jgi:hypothetical protein